MQQTIINQNIQSYLYLVNKPKATVVVAHGMMEHAMRYLEFVKFLNLNNYNVILFDQLGHGSKPRPALGHWEKGMFLESVNNYHHIVQYAKQNYQNVPVILFAHSMGSFIAQEYITVYPNDIDGLILSGSNAPMLLTSLGALVTNFYKEYAATPNQLLNNLMFKPYQNKFKPKRTNFDWLSSVNSEVDKYVQDPLCGFTSTTGFFKEFIPALAQLSTKNKLSKINKNLPILIISGKEDPVGNYGKGLTTLSNLYLKNNVKSVNLIIYPKARHELLNEFNRELVMQDINNWIKNIG